MLHNIFLTIVRLNPLPYLCIVFSQGVALWIETKLQMSTYVDLGVSLSTLGVVDLQGVNTPCFYLFGLMNPYSLTSRS